MFGWSFMEVVTAQPGRQSSHNEGLHAIHILGHQGVIAAIPMFIGGKIYSCYKVLDVNGPLQK